MADACDPLAVPVAGRARPRPAPRGLLGARRHDPPRHPARGRDGPLRRPARLRGRRILAGGPRRERRSGRDRGARARWADRARPGFRFAGPTPPAMPDQRRRQEPWPFPTARRASMVAWAVLGAREPDEAGEPAVFRLDELGAATLPLPRIPAREAPPRRRRGRGAVAAGPVGAQDPGPPPAPRPARRPAKKGLGGLGGPGRPGRSPTASRRSPTARHEYVQRARALGLVDAPAAPRGGSAAVPRRRRSDSGRGAARIRGSSRDRGTRRAPLVSRPARDGRRRGCDVGAPSNGRRGPRYPRRPVLAAPLHAPSPSAARVERGPPGRPSRVSPACRPGAGRRDSPRWPPLPSERTMVP